MKLAMVKEVLSPAGRAECLGEVPLLLLRWEDQVTAPWTWREPRWGDRVLLAFRPHRSAGRAGRCGSGGRSGKRCGKSG